MKDHRLLDGRALRDRILDDVAQQVRQADPQTLGRLISISVGEQAEAGVYVRGQASAAARVGLRFEHQTWPVAMTQEECKFRLVTMNDDPDILGIILQRPVPPHLNGDRKSTRLNSSHVSESRMPSSA